MIFETVAQLKLATLTAGQLVSTKGYYAAGDGGAADYIVAATQAVDGYGDHALAGGTVALLQSGGSVDVKQYGAKGDGTADDTAAIQAALDSGAATVLITGGTNGFIVNSSINIPPTVSLMGEYQYSDPREGLLFATMGSRILLNSSAGAQIIVNESSSITKTVILSQEVVIPSNAATIAGWAGTAVYIAAGSHGAYIGYSCIVGFTRALDTATSNTEQVRCEHLNIDCNRGIRIVACYDVATIDNCHCWPVASVGLVGLVEVDLQRAGAAYEFLDGGDWNKVVNSFSYGYARCVVVDNCNSVTISGCGADYTGSSLGGNLGFYVTGNSTGTRIVSCQAAAQETGIYIESTSTSKSPTLIDGCEMWASDSNGIVIAEGRALITGSVIRNSAGGNGITSISPENVTIANCSFTDIPDTAISNSVSTNPLRHSGCVFDTVTTVATNGYTPTVASASVLVLNGTDVSFVVTGTTNFGTLSPASAYTGKIVVLSFTAALTVINGGNMKTAGAANFVTSAGDTISFLSDGVNFNEISRSTNS